LHEIFLSSLLVGVIHSEASIVETAVTMEDSSSSSRVVVGGEHLSDKLRSHVNGKIASARPIMEARNDHAMNFHLKLRANPKTLKPSSRKMHVSAM